MPKGGSRVKLKMPNVQGGTSAALQAALAQQQKTAQAAQVAQVARTESAKMSTDNPGPPAVQPGPPVVGVPMPTGQPGQPMHPSQQQRVRQQQKPPPWFDGDDRHRSISIYPIYINKVKSLKGGRRVPKEIAIIRPILREMFLVLQHAGFACIGVPKTHPRDTFKAHPSNVGRLHILFKKEDGSPMKPDVAKTKMELLKYLCEKIPQMKHRANPQQMQEPLSSPSGSVPSSPATAGKQPAIAKAAAGKKRPQRKKRK